MHWWVCSDTAFFALSDEVAYVVFFSILKILLSQIIFREAVF